MKRLLFFISLLLTLTETPECKIYETYDEEKQKCIKVCAEDEYYDKEIISCIRCDEGSFINKN